MSQVLRLLLPVLFCSLAGSFVHAGSCQNGISPVNADSGYVNNANGTVTDTRTGLIWQQCAVGQQFSGGTCIGTATTYSWETALALSGGVTLAGRTNWRLPNAKELRSLVDECRVNPAINDALFPSTPSLRFWSASPTASNASNAWYVNFDDGSAYHSARSTGYAVRYVSSGVTTVSSVGLVSHYPLNSNAMDIGTNGNNGAISGAVSFDGGSAYLNPSATDSGSIQAAPALNRDTSFSIAVWVKPTIIDVGNVNAIAFERNGSDACGASSAANYGLSIYLGRFSFETSTLNNISACSLVRIASAEPATAGSWSHVAGVYDKATGGMSLYVNGVAAATGAGNKSLRTAVGAILAIGRNPGASQAFHGRSSDLRIYDRVLTAQEVAALASVRPQSNNVAEDFSPTANPNGAWSYGYKTTAVAPLQLFDNGSSTARGISGMYGWNASTIGSEPHIYFNTTTSAISFANTVTVPPRTIQMHPGANDLLAVLRWTVPTAGTYAIAGNFVGNDALAAARTASIRQNTTEIFSGAVGALGSTLPFAFSLTLTQGDTLDFSIDPAGAHQNDSTGLTLTIGAISAINGSCGSASGVVTTSPPTTSLCGAGNPSTVNGTAPGPWSWTCFGINGGTNASCATPDTRCALSSVSSIEMVDLSRSMTQQAVDLLYTGQIRTTFNVTCANGRFGVVRLPKIIGAALGGDAYALVQSSCPSKPVQQMAAAGLATPSAVFAAVNKRGNSVALATDPLVGPLANWVCQ